jgi:aspartyl-tRNA synthetase
MSAQRTNCNSCKEILAGQEIKVSGWVHRYRDQGGVLFVDLRDRSGLLQLVFDSAENPDLLEQANVLRSEFVIEVTGRLRMRSDDSINPKIETGKVELLAEELSIHNKSLPLPIPLDEHTDEASEERRLTFRYLDLRRERMQQSLIMRSHMHTSLRTFLGKEAFIEIETPILNKSTPEGARDFLVPSRLNPGEFYALPQSPQIFKQLCMIGGVERYYQIARCFRDEDLRKDRQPEFTQLDLELSFMTAQEIMQLSENMVKQTFQNTFKIDLGQDPLEQMPYNIAMEEYGTDKPDIRFDLKLIDLDEWAMTTEFQVFKKCIESGGRVKAICVPGGASLSRKEIDDLTLWVQQDFKAKGLAWIKVADSGLESVLTKFIPESAQQALLSKTNAKQGDIIFFGADKPSVVFSTLGALRVKMANHFSMIKDNEFKALWVIDFPLFEYDDEEKQLISLHHPFTAPRPDSLNQFMECNPRNDNDLKNLTEIKSDAYDFVLNGTELGGGSIRIHKHDIQLQALKLLGLDDATVNEQFGFLIDALQYGAPPHGGIAFGLDRILMIALGLDSIRDVIAFPKTQKGQCLMSQAPTSVDDKQLKEIFLKSLVKKD